MNNLWRLLQLYKPYRGWVLLGVLLTLITLLANIALMAISGWFITAMAIAGVAGISMNYFTPAAMIRAAAIMRTGGRYGERLVTHEATFRLLSGLRLWFYKKLEPLVPAALDDLRGSDLMSRISADIDMLDNFYIRVVVPVAVALISVVLTGWVISLYQGSLGLLLVCQLLLAGVFLPVVIARLGRQPGQEVVEQSSLLRTRVVDNLQGMAELTIYGAIDDSEKQLADNSRRWLLAQKKMGRVSGLAQAGLLLFSGLATWFVLFLAVPSVVESAIQPAELAMLVLFTLAAFEAVMPLPEAFRLLGQVQASANRLFAIIDRKPVVREPITAASRPENFELVFEQVTFRYRPDAEPVLLNLSMCLTPGMKLAVIGPTGAGKSSLIQLILRYREPEAGTITLGDRSLAEFCSTQLHDWFAVVPQQVYLFNTTIQQNLLMAKPEASQQELDHVCKVARILDFIEQQPEGYDTWVGETGIRLSGGQARRIAIARALLRNFQCLILDEPGEGLDNITERELLANVVAELGDRSLLLITHGQAGLTMVDEVMLLENGTIQHKA